MPVAEKPERLSLTDLQTQETVECMFNPNELRRRLGVNYAKKSVLGNSHAEHEYLNTENQEITFDLFYNVETPADLAKATDAMKFLESLAYAPENPESIAQNAPPRVLILWPNTLSIVARLLTIEFTHARWNQNGYTTQFTARTVWDESRIRRLTKQEVRQLGSLRPPQSADANNGGT